MAGINLVFTFAIALIFALLATKKVRFSKWYQTMYALPMAIASSPAAAIFLFIFRQKNGLLNNLLGTSISWTTKLPYAFWAVCSMTIWMHVGISFIFLLVGFRNVPEEVLESAWLDGAGPLARIRHILIYYIYENAMINGRFETACVQAVVLFILIFSITQIQFALEKRMVHYQ